MASAGFYFEKKMQAELPWQSAEHEGTQSNEAAHRCQQPSNLQGECVAWVENAQGKPKMGKENDQDKSDQRPRERL